MQSDTMEIRRAIEAKMLDKAPIDPPFHELLLKDPRAALEQETGRPVPEAVKVQVIQAPADTLVLVVPADTAPDGELTDAQLDAVAGGAFLQSAFSQVIHSLGDALSTVARKQQ